MSSRLQRARIALTGLLLLAGCTDSHPDSHPSVTFGAGATPGMSGMPAMPHAPAGPPNSSAESAAPVAGDAISIDNFVFVPTTLTIPAGSTVTWTNRDEEPHTIAAGDGSFHSPGMGAQGSYSHTFAAPGTFDYVCSIHPFMHGTVVVTR